MQWPTSDVYKSRSKVLNTLWLQEDDQDDVWEISGENPADDEWHDVILGNGLQALRVPVSGEGSSYAIGNSQMPPTGSRHHGLWAEDELMDLPRWHGLALSLNGVSIAENPSSWKDYRQTLQLRHGSLKTQYRGQAGGCGFEIDRRCWLSRSDERLLVIQSRLTVSADCELTVADAIHCAAAYPYSKLSLQADESGIAVRARMGYRLRQLGIASQVCWDAGQPAAEALDEINENPFAGELAVTRRWTMALKAGTQLTITKVAALAVAGDDLLADPLVDPLDEAQASIAAYRQDPAAARQAHEAEWERLWQSHIEVGLPRLQRLINVSLYHLYAQIPAGRAVAMGPSGLSSLDWHGRAFWDADLWMFPVTCLLHPEMGRCFTAYRHETLAGAKRNAAATGYQGAAYAWESAEFGDEMVPIPYIHHQRHINSCVALAQWWDYLISGDEEYFKGPATAVILDTARYWASRVTYNADKDRYELLHIKCPDESAKIQDNNATTNYSAVWTLRLAQRVCALSGQEPDPQWQTIIDKMWIPFDDKAQRYIEYDGFNRFGEYDKGQKTIKQADTTLLVYPYEMPMTDTVKANVVSYYRQFYPASKIMMSSAFDGIVDCELGDEQAGFASLCDLLPHFRYPFCGVSETPKNTIYCFLTGVGGFLQLLVMGFAGLRLHEKEFIFNSCLPKEIGYMHIKGLHFGGKRLDVRVDGDGVHVASDESSLPFTVSGADLHCSGRSSST